LLYIILIKEAKKIRYLDNIDVNKQKCIINFAKGYAKKLRARNIVKQKDVLNQISRREIVKKGKKDTKRKT
jgi:hypothetical protein